MGENTAATAKQVILAIQGTGGIKTRIARKLDVTRQTVDSYLRRWPTVMAAWKHERETIGDIAESKLLGNIRDGDQRAIEFYLNAQGRDRGYGRQQTINVNMTYISELREIVPTLDSSQLDEMKSDLGDELFAKVIAGLNVPAAIE